MLRQLIFDKVTTAIKQAEKEGLLGQIDPATIENIVVEKPKNTEFGDFAVNVSPFSRFAKMPPVKVAETLLPYINLEDMEMTVVAGFINFKIEKNWLNKNLESIIRENKDFGRSDFGALEKTMLEYVSANPTGPLHIGHGRWAAVGNSLTNIMNFAGWDVDQEFYINDAGNQINNLGKSLWIRVLQALGNNAKFPEAEEEGAKNYYTGDYLIPVAEEYLKNNREKAEELYKNNPNPYNLPESIVQEMSNFAKAIMLEDQRNLLSRMGVNFKVWYSETSLHKAGKVEETIEKLKSRNELFEKDGAIWFKSSNYGDDQDRVIIKSDGSYTYLTADIAYHYDKLLRGYERMINIWGADHHGYVPRIKAAIAALGYDSNKLEVLLGQLVNLIVDGEAVRMGKRKKMYTLSELIDEVGIDATRYWMIMRSTDTTLDFDVNLAKSCSDENPVYYVQYAHARSASILRNASTERLDQDTLKTLPPFVNKDELDNLVNPEKFDINILNSLWNTMSEKELESTKALILKLESFQDIVVNAAKARAPYQIARFVQELAGEFHHFYTFTRVLNIEEPVMRARLCLVFATKQILNNALKLLGVSAPESM